MIHAVQAATTALFVLVSANTANAQAARPTMCEGQSASISRTFVETSGAATSRRCASAPPRQTPSSIGYEAIADGLLSPDDASLKDRVAELSGIRDQARADAERISVSVDRLAPTITPDALNRSASAARRKLRDRTSGYRRDHLRALTQRVEVISKTEAGIIGSRTELLRALASSDGGSYAAAGGVLGFKPKWRARAAAPDRRRSTAAPQHRSTGLLPAGCHISTG